MRKLFKWVGLGLAGLLALAIASVAIIFLLSEQSLARRHDALPERLPEPTAAQLADAPRQARILGCVSCHGEGVRGNLMMEIPNVARVHAPNLTEIAARSTDQQLAAAIRQGVGHDGRDLFVMPSPMYSRLSDGEVAALIAWIRSQKRATGATEGFTPGPVGRFAIVTGKIVPAPAKLEDFRTQAPIDLGRDHVAGRRIAAIVCSECHGPALFGQKMESGAEVPDLVLAGAYDLEDFRTLMRTGKGTGGRELGLMSKVSRQDFAHLSDEEIAKLHAYLKARADRAAR